MNRTKLSKASRIVIKLGTGLLINALKQPDMPQLVHLVQQISTLCAQGKEVIVVSSGAVGVGCGVLEYKEKPHDLIALQACAAAGQPRLMGIYEDLFTIYGHKIAQILLTHDDLENDVRCNNARNTIDALLKHNVIPIINENDTVAVEELKFGDNDQLSALVASLVSADLLILLTTVDGLIRGYGTPQAELVSYVETLDDNIMALAGGTTSETAVGGMKTKLFAAQIATQSGVSMVIAPGRRRDILNDLFNGAELGTFFAAEENALTSRKHRIAFFHHTHGTLTVDDAMKYAICELGKSLRFAGITKIKGDFGRGDVVTICDQEGHEFARGVVEFSHGELCTHELHKGSYNERIILCNNIVLLHHE